MGYTWLLRSVLISETSPHAQVKYGFAKDKINRHYCYLYNYEDIQSIYRVFQGTQPELGSGKHFHTCLPITFSNDTIELDLLKTCQEPASPAAWWARSISTTKLNVRPLFDTQVLKAKCTLLNNTVCPSCTFNLLDISLYPKEARSP